MTTDIKTFDQLQKDVYDRIVLVGHSSYFKTEKLGLFWKNYLTVNEVSKLQEFVTDAQWKCITQLCIRFSLNIEEIVEDLFFECEKIPVRYEDYHCIELYYVPTNIKGWFGEFYYTIKTDGTPNT